MFIKAGIHTSINTAGFNADDEVLKKLCSLDGIAFIVSIDSNKEEINDRVRGRKGALSTALNLISRIQEYSVGRSLIAVECVISKINLEEIDNMIEFFSTKGILQLRFQQVVISGRAQKNRNDVSLDEGVLLHNLIEEKAQKYYERCQADSSLCPMEIHFVDQSSMIRTGIKRGLNWGGIIGPTGRLKPSGYLDVTTDSYRNYGSFINLWNAGYKNVWKIPDIVERFKDINNIWDICKVKESNLDRMTLTFKR